jgi:hypothetical protein
MDTVTRRRYKRFAENGQRNGHPNQLARPGCESLKSGGGVPSFWTSLDIGRASGGLCSGLG